MLDGLNVDETQKRNILANVKFGKDNPNVYDEVKKSIRLMKGSVIEDKDDVDEDTFYGKSWKGNRSDRRYESGVGDRRFGDRGYERSNRSRYSSSDDRRHHDGRVERNFNNQRKDEHRRSTSHSRKDSNSSNKSQNRSRGERSSSRPRNNDYYRCRFSNEESVQVCFKEEIEAEEEILVALWEDVNKLLMDCGATKTVAGEIWMDNFLKLVDDELRERIEERPDKRIFRFGRILRALQRRQDIEWKRP